MPNTPPHSDLGRFWTFPNVLTLFRLVLTIPITILIFNDGPLVWIMGLVVLAVATDYFDGRVARWSHTVSDWGKVLDPFVDKVGAGLVVMALTFRGSLPMWFLAAIVVRDLSIFLGGGIIRLRTGQIVMSMWSGKVAVTAVAITVLAVLLKADPPLLRYCIWITTGLLAWSFIRYFIRFFALLGQPADSHAEEEN